MCGPVGSFLDDVEAAVLKRGSSNVRSAMTRSSVLSGSDPARRKCSEEMLRRPSATQETRANLGLNKLP